MQAFQRRIINNLPRPDNDLSVLSIGYEQTVPGKQVGPCVRNKYILLYVLSGRGSFCGQSLDGRCGILICPNQKHEYHSDEGDPMRYAWISFAGEKAEEHLAAANITARNHVFKYGWADKTEKWISQIVAEQPSATAAAEYLLGWFHILLSYHMTQSRHEGLHTKTGSQQYVSMAVQYIKNNFYHRELRVADIAAFIGIDRHYLSNIFTKEMGISPQQYLVRTRIDHAQALLRDLSLNVTEVAASVGYADSLWFSKLFHQYVGMSPTEYRRCFTNA